MFVYVSRTFFSWFFFYIFN
uniref:Uncharacterized protein n=1 Tax=Rhizophora mucronata TaxID=61149 RepID=A0A2P2NXW5_RHIMU